MSVDHWGVGRVSYRAWPALLYSERKWMRWPHPR